MYALKEWAKKKGDVYITIEIFNMIILVFPK